MREVFVSTGAFVGRLNGRDHRLIPPLAKNIVCDGFELMFYKDWYDNADGIGGFLKSSGLRFPTFHCEKGVGELLAKEDFNEAFRLFEINCRAAETVGARLMVLHLWNGIISDSNISANFSAFSRLKEIAYAHGVTLTVENVVAHGGSPLKLWHRLLLQSPDALFTYDTKMAQFDLENEKAFSEENFPLWKNVRHLHINDRAGGYRDWTSLKVLQLGRGDVDFETFFKNLSRTDYRGDFTVEATAFTENGGLDFDSLNESVKKVRELSGKYLGRA